MTKASPIDGYKCIGNVGKIFIRNCEKNLNASCKYYRICLQFLQRCYKCSALSFAVTTLFRKTAVTDRYNYKVEKSHLPESAVKMTFVSLSSSPT